MRGPTRSTGGSCISKRRRRSCWGGGRTSCANLQRRSCRQEHVRAHPRSVSRGCLAAAGLGNGLFHNVGEIASLMRRDLELQRRGLAASIRARIGAGPPRAAAVHLLDVQDVLACIPNRHKHHAVVGKLSHAGQRGGLRAAALGARGGEKSGWLAHELPPQPEASGLIPESLQHRADHTEPCWAAEQEPIVVRQGVHHVLTHRRVFPIRMGNLPRQDDHRGLPPRCLHGSLDGLSQCLHVPVCRVVDNGNLGLATSRLGGQLLEEVGTMGSLVHSDPLFQIRRLPGPVPVGEGVGSVRAAPVHLVQVQDVLGTVAHGHEEHAVVGQLGDCGEDGGLRAPALGAG
mmetsp:Transcript_13438/g.32890  ORF Transcript_13438/g.32890 Transcript_13438/m.32890 type:complete len:344 (-) Transcript_13438:485-1516(-)